jgi:hypothetical protein
MRFRSKNALKVQNGCLPCDEALSIKTCLGKIPSHGSWEKGGALLPLMIPEMTAPEKSQKGLIRE